MFKVNDPSIARNKNMAIIYIMVDFEVETKICENDSIITLEKKCINNPFGKIR